MLHALQTFIENEDGVSVAGTAEDGEAAVEAAKSLQPDLVLMDIKMPRLNGIEATRKIVSEIPGTRVLALTTFSTLDYVVPALRAGAAGYLVKDARPDEILAAIRNAMDDSLPLSPSVVRLMARQVIGGALDTQAVAGATADGGGGSLPARSRCSSSWGNGLSNREIAKKMYISEGRSRPTWPTPVPSSGFETASRR